MTFAINAFTAEKVASTATNLIFAALNADGSASTTQEVRFIGTGLSFDEITGTLAGDVDSIVYYDIATTTALQTITLDAATSATSAADMTAFLAAARAGVNDAAALATFSVADFDPPAGWGVDLVTSATYADIAVRNGTGTQTGTFRLVGTGIEEFGAPGGASVSYIEVYNLAGTLVGTVDYSGDVVGLDKILYGFGFGAESLTQFLMRGNDTVVTHASNTDVIDAGIGDDTITGNGTSDTVSYMSAQGAVTASLLAGTASGGGGADTLTGIENLLGSMYEGDSLTGSTGNNILDGGFDNAQDFLFGGAGDDTFILRAGTDIVNDSAGVDTIVSTVTRDLKDFTAQIEKLVILGAATNATGNSLANTLTGNANANVLDGGVGADTMLGGTGNDTYIVDNANDVITDAAEASSVDTVKTSETFVLTAGAEIEVLQTTSAVSLGALNLTGNEFAQTITGNNGANVLDGGTDALTDTLIGLGGNDTYNIGAGADTVTEGLNGGTDTIVSSIDRDLTNFANVENLTMTAATGVTNAWGNTLNNKIVGAAAGDSIWGGSGGNDTMTGNTGGDTFWWDRGADIVTDQLNAQGDAIQTSNWNVGDFASIQAIAVALNTTTTRLSTYSNGVLSTLQLNGIAIGSLSASDFRFQTATGAQTINGFANKADHLFGADGNDVLNGGTDTGTFAVADYLFGETGNDTLNGGKGGDRMYGGTGDDTFYVDSAADFIVDNAGAGSDTILTSITYVMPANAATKEFENLGTTNAAGTGAMNLTGNALANTITGNDGVNILNGGVGADTMNGNGGSDTYYIDNELDAIGAELAADGAADHVKVVASATVNSYVLGSGDVIEFLEGSVGTSTLRLDLTGNASAQTITGNSGINVISGKDGNDTLIGGAGMDYFVFDTVANASTNKDKITDFNAIYDTVRLENTAVFTGLGSTLGTLSSAKFYIGAAAHDLDDRIIYNKLTGELHYDSNGSIAGGDVVFATLANKGTMTYADFVVI
ncbi:MAG: calcium-binding protein [Hyphomicrobium sp.]